MNVEAIQSELERRLKVLVTNIYVTPPAAADPPCAVIAIPTIESYHVNHATELTRSQWEVTMHAGRGDTPDAFARLSQWLSTDTETSFVRAIEDKPTAWNKPNDGAAWHRLTVNSTNGSGSGAETVSITFNLTIDA